MAEQTKILSVLRAVLFNVAALVCLIIFCAGYFESPQWDWSHLFLSLVGAGLAALVGNLDAIEFFKAGPAGLEAKTRQIVQEAESTITELREIAIVLGGTLIDTIAAAGRLGGPDRPTQNDLQRERVLTALQKIGVCGDDLAQVRKADSVWVSIDYVHGIMANYLKGMEAHPDFAAIQARWRIFQEPINRSASRPKPDALETFLASIHPLEPWRRELLDDYRHYLETGEHRRPDIWRARGLWQDLTNKGEW